VWVNISIHTIFSPPEARLNAMPTNGSINASARVLVAEDDRAVRESLVRALQLEGYTVVAANNGAEALDAVRQAEPDVLLLDVSMPLVDGLTVCRVLRSEDNRLPVLMLTARTETSDRVAGLDAGADDYLSKPFDLDELLARVRALLRRSVYGTESADSDLAELVLDDLRIDRAARRVFRADREIQLSKTEFDLLELLVSNKGIVLEHSTIYDRIWHYDFGPDSKNLAVYIGYLRGKTEAEGEARLIHTVRGVGYTARVDS
jgi:two-component system response regulator MprA